MDKCNVTFTGGGRVIATITTHGCPNHCSTMGRVSRNITKLLDIVAFSTMPLRPPHDGNNTTCKLQGRPVMSCATQKSTPSGRNRASCNRRVVRRVRVPTWPLHRGLCQLCERHQWR